MRTNIDIDDDLLTKAMQAGPYTTKKDTVEAGLRLLARQAAYREILKWEGKLKWEGDESIDWTKPDADEATVQEEALSVQEQQRPYQTRRATPAPVQPASRAKVRVTPRAGR